MVKFLVIILLLYCSPVRTGAQQQRQLQKQQQQQQQSQHLRQPQPQSQPQLQLQRNEVSNQGRRSSFDEFVRTMAANRRPVAAGTRIKFHDYMHELHSKMQENGGFMTVRIGNTTRHLGYISSVHSFLNVSHTKQDDCNVFHFNLTDIAANEDVLAAELRLNVLDGPRNASWHVYELQESGEQQLVDVIFSNSTLLALDLTNSIRRWYREQQRVRRLIVKQLALELHGDDDEQPAVTTTTPPLPPIQDQRYSISQMQPNIVVYTRSRDVHLPPDADRTAPRGAKRTKRNARRMARQKRNRICSLQRMEVDFERVGWSDWIIAPLSYQAGICVGTCNFPLSDQVNATNHATIQALVHSVNNAVPSPCCVPTKLSAIALLFQDHAADKVILKNYSDMVAEACGCR